MKPEILAPAGGMEQLRAALRCGADAVYIGGQRFSARANAANFSLEEIGEGAELCHLYGAKLHLAVNTVCFDDELSAAADFIGRAAERGVDAFIIQDMAVARLCREIAPTVERHASTQMSIHSPEGALLAKEEGFQRVVLARELSEKEIAGICGLGIDVECFVHGALCMCLSGQCYMSAMIGGRSANRGGCAQTCRLPFSADSSEYYALSLKDMSLTAYVQKMMSLGVKSFKIEGRMKRPEYVAAAVKALRDCVDKGYADTSLLRDVFSRSGFTDGYFTGKRQDMFGVRTKEDVAAAKTAFPKIHEYYRRPGKAASLDMEIKIKSGEEMRAFAKDSDGAVSQAVGAVPETAKKRAVTGEDIKKQFAKLGDTVFEPGKINCSIDEGLFVPASEINELRRRMTDAAAKSRKELFSPKHRVRSFALPEGRTFRAERTSFVISVSTEEQLEAALKLREEGEKTDIVLPLDLCRKRKADSSFIIRPPRFITEEGALFEELVSLSERGYKRLLCENVAYLRLKDRFCLTGGFGLNVTNSLAAAELQRAGLESLIVSPETKFSKIKRLRAYGPGLGLIIYGRLPLMLTRNCPVKNQLGSCKNCPHFLRDRTGRQMPVYCNEDKTYTEIYNSEKIFLADRLDEIPENISRYFLCFTDEEPPEVERIYSAYRYKTGYVPSNITKGLYYRGVE